MIQDFDYKKTAKELFNDIQKVDIKNTPNLRKVRRKYSKKLAQAAPEQILDFARYFIKNYNYRWIAFEIIKCHKTAIKLIGVKELGEFGKEINSWGAVDVFAGFIAGPAWRNGQVPDELILSWANSKDHWWRRTALVCTVPLNRRSAGGQGDIYRTLKICGKLAADKNDMVIKALSWALRELITHDPESVRKFMTEYNSELAARVKREVKNKLTMGIKNARRQKK
jgi:3-methyladenine DNA glycosylase AlkD